MRGVRPGVRGAGGHRGTRAAARGQCPRREHRSGAEQPRQPGHDGPQTIAGNRAAQPEAQPATDGQHCGRPIEPKPQQAHRLLAPQTGTHPRYQSQDAHGSVHGQDPDANGGDASPGRVRYRSNRASRTSRASPRKVATALGLRESGRRRVSRPVPSNSSAHRATAACVQPNSVKLTVPVPRARSGTGQGTMISMAAAASA
ncbi:hypothetical protein THSYN_14930 [Candidatus Thiodictyon syntrophicum]|uniref:Uncharacterized protein n=1 Tax=Candidatus Thiodictyon syntrophicum TaxID=1166950 RepID=A0A2K8U982_9GAMM|nr:hypothetical protein THSYN_14930 [Candidatus Thiodictyon syntrophicum]